MPDSGSPGRHARRISAPSANHFRPPFAVAILAALLVPALPAATAHAQAGTCGPAQIGQPCAAEGPATQAAAEPVLNLGAGNPVHLVTGNKTRRDTDLPAAPGAPGLEIVRHYNALDPRVHPLGRGWAGSYDTRVHAREGLVQIVQADGSRIDFADPDTQGSCAPHQAGTGELARTASGWRWQWPDLRRLDFDDEGRLIRIVRPDGGMLDIERDARPGPTRGLALAVRDSGGDALLLHYEIGPPGPRLARVDTPLGRFAYRHAPAPDGQGWLLVEAARPDGMLRRYRYDPARQNGHAHALTGAELSDAHGRTLRLGSWSYDRAGRVATADAGDGTEAMRFAYPQAPGPGRPGLTIVDTPAGATHFHTRQDTSQYRLAQVSGPGCPGCPAPDTRAGYDTAGRLDFLNGLRIQPGAQGGIARLEVPDSGWPGLTLDYRKGRLSGWSSAAGGERRAWDAGHGMLERRHANGGRWTYRHDRQGRPVALDAVGGDADAPVAMRLDWRNRHLARVQTPHETERRRYDAHGRLSARRLSRPAQAGLPALEYEDRYRHDAQGRLRLHRLPEGGALRYHWDGPRLAGVDWTDAAGRTRPVVRQPGPGQPGYVHGNGLRTLGWTQAGRLAGLLVADDGARIGRHGGKEDNRSPEIARRDGPIPPLFAQTLHYDASGRLSEERLLADGYAQTLSYGYDAASRLIAARTRETGRQTVPHRQTRPDDGHARSDIQHHYAWRADGSARHAPAIERDASGLPVAAAGRTLRHDALHRLQEIRQGGRRLLSQRHDAHGRRILREDDAEAVRYLYADGRLAAEIRTRGGRTGVTRRYVHAGWTPVAVIDYASPQPLNGVAVPASREAALYAIHADAVGLPRLATDETGKVRWRARFDALGRAVHLEGDLTLDLRLPGQLHDTATGWHDNGLRTYDPSAGHYLQPDPLGPLPGTQAYGYAAQQPRRHADPLGLLLYAFDGTRNAPSSLTNVWLLSQAYAGGDTRYHAGPGTPEHADWDAATAASAPIILATQWERLLADLSAARFAHTPTQIDLLGFSRGAALARHFGNLIAERLRNGRFWLRDDARGVITACVGLRFMGLFDTVEQFGLLGSGNAAYDLAVTDAWQWVAHAVALNERRWLFPLTVLEGSTGSNIVEAHFVGAHSDIGGGYLPGSHTPSDRQGDLSDVALNWMRWQAMAAGVPIDALPVAQRKVTDPILHDERAPAARYAQNGDRAVFDAEGDKLLAYQHDHPRYGEAARREVEAFIARIPGWMTADTNAVGRVDMDAYRAWLAREIGFDDAP